LADPLSATPGPALIYQDPIYPSSPCLPVPIIREIKDFTEG